MAQFKKIKAGFPYKTYQIGIINKGETLSLSKVNIIDRYSFVGAIPLTSRTRKYWDRIKNTLVVLQYTAVAHDYSIKPDTEKILSALLKQNYFLIVIDLKRAAMKAGLGSLGFNNLIWSPRFGFDCKIIAWAITEEIRGYKRGYSPAYLPACSGCGLQCHKACPAYAFSGNSIKDFKFDAHKCVKVIGNQIKKQYSDVYHSISGWRGVVGGINHCRACQEQIPCKPRKY